MTRYAGEFVDDCVQLGFRAIEQSDDRDVDMPELVGLRRSDADLWFCGIDPPSWASPTTLSDEFGPGRCRREHLADSLAYSARVPSGMCRWSSLVTICSMVPNSSGASCDASADS